MKKEWEDATNQGEVTAASNLLDQGEAIDARDAHGQTALMNASRLGHKEIVCMLIERGADLNVTAKYNLTALMLAIINGHDDVARALIEAGADLNARGGKGAPGFHDQTALTLARGRGQKRVVELLSQYGAKE